MFSCIPRSMPITIAITILTTHNIKIPKLVYQIQTSKFYSPTKHRNPSTNKTSQTPCITRTQKHNRTQHNYGVLQNPKN